jgi:hypothetical protein
MTSIRAKRVLAYLENSGPDTATDLPTDVARSFVQYVTDRIEQSYDDAVTELLNAGLAEQYDGTDGQTYIRATVSVASVSIVE